MTSNLTILFLIAHFLADYYLQPQMMSETKTKRYAGVLLHSLIYMASFGLICILQNDLVLPIGMIVLSHFLIDSSKYLIEKYIGNKGERILYVADQFLHLAIIVVAAGSARAPSTASLITTIPRPYLQWVLLLIVIMKPVNVTFKKMSAKYQPTKSEKIVSPQTSDGLPSTGAEAEPIDGAGATIGNLERIIAAILIYSSQYAAMGLIFTAKSIARYNKIAEDQVFAEYYLIGSLFSVLSVMVCYWIVFSVL